MDPLDDLSKSSRSVRVSIHNTSSKRLTLKSHPLISGQWKVSPPENILPLSTVEFGSESSNLLGGTEAGSIYQIEGTSDAAGQFEFIWNNPYFGKRGFRRVAPPGYECDFKVVDANACVLRFTVKELDSGFLKETEDIESEIKTLNTLITECDTAVKGMTKMMQVYQAQNDAKQVKLVEATLRDKNKHLEDLRLKKDSLQKEIETVKRLESDPKFMEQNLNKIRESIDSSVKARKGMEHMRDVYAAQKDTKSIEGLEKQIDVKKRETDALRKREQKVIQKIIELKKALGIGATGVPKVRRVQALYDYTKSSEDELSINTGDIIDVVNDDNPEWLGGQIDGQVGFFPRTFVKFLEDAPTIGINKESVAVEQAAPADQEDFTSLYPKARVVYAHSAADEGEITLALGDTLTVYSWEDDYWWEGVMNDVSGYFPSNCVEWIEPEGEIVVHDNSYSYYEETGETGTTPPQPSPIATATAIVDNAAASQPAPTPAPTPVQATIPTSTPISAMAAAKSLGGNRLTINQHQKVETPAPVQTPTPTPAPTPAPVPVHHQPTPLPVLPAKRELPVAPKATPTPVVNKPAATTTPVTISPSTQSPSTVSPSTSTPSTPTSTPSISLVGGSFEKLIQPLLQEVTKQLVDAHQKETQQLHQRIAQLEKELKSFKESGNNNITTNNTNTNSFAATLQQHTKPPSASPGTIKAAPIVSTASVVSKATIVRK